MAQFVSLRVAGPLAVALSFGVAAVVVVCSVTGAAADEPAAQTFGGTCEMTGVILHEPPMTNEPAPVQVRGRFEGKCSGEFTNRRGRTRRLDDAPGVYKARPAGSLSCLGGTATGNGRLILRHRTFRRK